MADANKSGGVEGLAGESKAERDDLPVCGVIRPMSAMGEAYPGTHWLEVHKIIVGAAKAAGYAAKLVSESDRAGIIVSEIVQNLYDNPIVVCDVSNKNPNVFFELGMRITFQKPVIVITDDATAFTSDISAIKHLQYRRDLRLQATLDFQEELTRAIIETVEAAKNPKNRDYLQQFGPIETTRLGVQEFDVKDLMSSIRELQSNVRAISETQVLNSVPKPRLPSSAFRKVMSSNGLKPSSFGNLFFNVSTELRDKIAGIIITSFGSLTPSVIHHGIERQRTVLEVVGGAKLSAEQKDLARDLVVTSDPTAFEIT